jgi:hypothetical protein
MEIVYDEEKQIFCTGQTRAAKAGQKSLVLARRANEQTKEKPLSFALFESPFASVSKVSRGHPSIVSMRRHYTGVFCFNSLAVRRSFFICYYLGVVNIMQTPISVVFLLHPRSDKIL